MVFLKTILILIMVYYLLKILARLFAPKIINYAAKKTEVHFKERFGDYVQNQHETGQKVGDVIINKKHSKKNAGKEQVGDYIDFEEID